MLKYIKSSYVPKCYSTCKSGTADTHQKYFYHLCQLFSPLCTNVVNYFPLPPPPPPPKLVIYKLYINFYQYKLVLFLFSHLLASTDLIILLGPMLQALIYCLCLFLHDLHRLNLLCQVICLSQKGFKIIFIKIDIIKVNIINIKTKNTHFMNKKCDIIRIFINKDYIIISV